MLIQSNITMDKRGTSRKVVVVVIFYFSSQDAQANLPSRRGRDVPSFHKKNEYGVMIGKKTKKKKKNKKPSQGQNWKRACEKKGTKRE